MAPGLRPGPMKVSTPERMPPPMAPTWPGRGAPPDRLAAVERNSGAADSGLARGEVLPGRLFVGEGAMTAAHDAPFP